jgi:putative pyruvate formate lyase activating enzyme
MQRRLQKNLLNRVSPSYLKLSSNEVEERIREAFALIKGCRLCPRSCGVDRTEGEKGFCRTGSKAMVSSWGPHFGEERPLVGKYGSGTIFFAYCNLGCIYCQNYTISHLGEGMEITPERLASIMLELQSIGCHNINLVTPTHQMPMILEALPFAIKDGLSIPIVYNCGGYESVDALKILDGIVDIYMPDFKYTDPEVAKRFSLAEDYPDVARRAIKEMYRQVGDLLIEEGIAIRGLLVRHLVLPEGLAGTDEVVRFLAQEISKNTYLNIMDQYHPCYEAFEHPPLNRRITSREYKRALDVAIKAGIKRIDGLTI